MCRYEKVSCKYADLGCGVTPYRKDIQEHQTDDKAHLHIAMDTVILLKKECTFLRAQMFNVRLEKNGEPTGNIAPFTFELRKYAEKNRDGYTYHNPFYSHPGGYELSPSVHVHGVNDGIDGAGTHVSVFIYVENGEFDDDLDFPFKGTVTIELLNQLENKNHYQMSFYVEAEANDGEGSTQFITNKELGFNVTKKCQYLKDDCLVFRISVDVPSYKPWLLSTN